MIDAISTLTVQSASLRQASQSVSSYSASTSVAAQINFTGSRIRFDNQMDLAIIEFRSNETGDVLRQYPTEPQIQAFARAAATEAKREAAHAAAEHEANLAAIAQTAPQPSSAPARSAAPQPTQVSAPVPQPSAPAQTTTTVSVPATTDSGSSGGEASAGSTQSIVV